MEYAHCRPGNTHVSRKLDVFEVVSTYERRNAPHTIRLYIMITIGSIIAALGYALFQVPHGIAAGGVSGIAILINAGVVGGVGLGMVFGAGGSLGGTGIIGRILQNRWGVPLSSVYLYTDGLIIVTAGVLLGWEAGLFAMLTLFLNGVASDHVLEGPSAVRTATIVTNEPEAVSKALSERLGRGATFWTVTGSYTKQARGMVLCTVGRPQVNELKHMVSEIEPVAFLTIGMSHQASGGNFLPLDRAS